MSHAGKPRQRIPERDCDRLVSTELRHDSLGAVAKRPGLLATERRDHVASNQSTLADRVLGRRRAGVTCSGGVGNGRAIADRPYVDVLGNDGGRRPIASVGDAHGGVDHNPTRFVEG